MDNAVKLNKLIKEKSSEAQLLLLNLPPPAKDESGDYHCILYIICRCNVSPGIVLSQMDRSKVCPFSCIKSSDTKATDSYIYRVSQKKR